MYSNKFEMCIINLMLLFYKSTDNLIFVAIARILTNAINKD